MQEEFLWRLQKIEQMRESAIKVITTGEAQKLVRCRENVGQKLYVKTV